MATACGSCTAPTGDGSTLCGSCTRELGTALLTAASIAGDLDDAVARLLKRGGGGRSSETSAPLPVDLEAADVARKLRGWLFGGVGLVLAEDEPSPSPAIEPCAWWLARNVQRVRQHADAVKIHKGITEAVARALAVIDRKPERIYAGPCTQCGADLLGTAGDTSITCACGTEHSVSDRQLALQLAMYDLLGSATWCAGTAAAVGVDLSENTIRTWVKRGKLVSHGQRPAPLGGRPFEVYRFGDVLDLAAARRPGTRIKSEKVPASAANTPGTRPA